MAGCLFAELGYGQVWQRLCAGLDGLPLAAPTASAAPRLAAGLARRPCGRCLGCSLARPLWRRPLGAGWWLLVCAIDATTLPVADPPPTMASTHPAGHHGGSGYRLLRLVALVACGTRSLIEVVFGPTSSGETTMTTQLTEHLHAGMLVLCDRNLTTAALTGRIAATGAQLLGRCKANRKLPMVAACPTDPGCRGSAAWRSASSMPRSKC